MIVSAKDIVYVFMTYSPEEYEFSFDNSYSEILAVVCRTVYLFVWLCKFVMFFFVSCVRMSASRSPFLIIFSIPSFCCCRFVNSMSRE